MDPTPILMDWTVIAQLAIVLGAIYLGARLGSIGIGFAGGLGVLVLALFGTAAKSGLLGDNVAAAHIVVAISGIATDVILIIMSVIAAIAAMQVAGGVDWLVVQAEKLLRKHPKYITYFAPLITYAMTMMAGTGHTAFSTLPVIAEVAKEQGIRPSRPLSIAVVASQVAITASPISAAVVYLAAQMEAYSASATLPVEGDKYFVKGAELFSIDVGYLDILAICIPTTLLAVILTSIVCNFLGKELKDDPVYQERLAKGLITKRGVTNIEIKKSAKFSVLIFVIAILSVMCYATVISDKVALIKDPILNRDSAIIVFMLTAASIITLFSKIDASEILSSSIFKSGMSACICILGVAWLGTTFVNSNMELIKSSAGDLLDTAPWLLAVALFLASMLLYSQASTAKALMPAAIAASASPVSIVASFAAVSALFILPTYPTLLAAVEMDDTGSTRIGKYVFNHPFIIPGTICLALSVLFGFIWGSIYLG